MAKKSKRSKGRSKKWSRANLMNFALGGVVALSMILGSVFVFGGAPQPTAPVSTAPIVATAQPPVMKQNSTPTSAVTPTVVVSPTLATPATPPPATATP